MTQQQALEIMKLGRNIYLTGAAGSGKTFLLNQYIKFLKNKEIAVGITASTGVAATHMNGTTIHSWSGMGVKDSISDKDLLKLLKKYYLKHIFRTKVLIIDEVSMLHPHQLDLVDAICKIFKANPKPFGGMQIVLCGDFFQLPPVNRDNSEIRFVDQSEIWNNMDMKICYLDEQHRQKDDKITQILNDIRTNKTGEHTLQDLRQRYNKQITGFVKPTRLYTHNVDVIAINNRELNLLQEKKKYKYTMQVSGGKALIAILQKSCLAPEELFLKKGAIVMFVKNNFDQGYVNGTMGRIIDFDENNFPVVETKTGKQIIVHTTDWIIEEEGKIKAMIRQMPLRLAWAITVHKSQGMTIDAVEMDLSKSFVQGMGYVALSRARSLESMRLMGLNQMALQVNQDVLEFDKDLKDKSQIAMQDLENLSLEEKDEKQKQFLASITPKAHEKKVKAMPGQTYEETKKLVLQKLPLQKIAKIRGFTEQTIVSHLEKLIEQGEKSDLIKYLQPAQSERLKIIKAAFEKTEDSK
ncbi:MAG: AAA family ATPase, partial [Patescibacteria group bacterium]|nr:AAA family ATPase [Patescibacteria group bacterium]